MKKLITAIILTTFSMMIIACGGEKTEAEAEAAANALMGALDDAVKEAEKAEDAEKKDDTPFVASWELDIDKTLAEDPKAKNMKDEEKEQMKAMFGAMKMSFNITADGKISMETAMGGETKAEAATWELQGKEGNVYKVKTIDEKDKKEEVIDIVVDGDSMVMTKDGESVYLKKQ